MIIFVFVAALALITVLGVRSFVPAKDLAPASRVNIRMIAMVAVASAAIFAIIAQCYKSDDTYFLIATGRYILENGFPTTNPFLLHENFRIVIQQWVVCVIDSTLYDTFGWPGIFALSCIGEGVLVLIFWLMLRGMYPGKKLVVNVYTLVFAILTACYYASGRPYLLFGVIVVSELFCLERYSSTGKMRFLIFLIPVSTALVNVQASMWPFFFCFLLAYAVPKRLGTPTKRIALMAPVYAVAGLINPYGWRGALYLFLGYSRYLTSEEMESPQIFSFLGILIVGLIVFVLIRRKEKPNPAHLLLFVGTVILSAVWQRCVFMLMLCGAFLVLDLSPNDKNEQRMVTKFDRVLNGFTAAFFAACCPLLICLGITAQKDPPRSATRTAEAAADYLEENDELDARLYTLCGSYYEFRGCTNVYLDNRAELFVKRLNGEKDVLEEVNEMESFDAEDCREFLDAYDFDYISVSPTEPLYIYCADHPDEFELIVEDEYYSFYKVTMSS